MFKVEKGIAMPQGWARRSCKYPFKTMEIGDSFFVPGEPEKLRQIVQQTSSSAERYKSSGMAFSVRQIKDAENTGVRVWRIK